MHTAVRWILVALLALGGASLSGIAGADVSCGPGDCTNAADGDNDSDTDQGGDSASGDAVAGQVGGIVSSGRTSVDATNRSEDVDVSSGDTEGSNDASTFVGQNDGTATVTTTDVTVGVATNAQDGDNSADVVQAADATSGDAVGGQVLGVVTAAGGSADVVAANTSNDVDVETGDSESANELAAFVGQTSPTSILVSTADVTGDSVDNGQDGDNDLSANQAATSASGDGVGGQVLGVVSAGDASIDATNESTDVDIESGDATSANDGASLTGQTFNTPTIFASDVSSTVGDFFNGQDGDNGTDTSQTVDATTGDGVGGQVIGVVTSSGGSADIVAANTSEDVDAGTGDADAANQAAVITGQTVSSPDISTADVTGPDFRNAQDGDNDFGADQTSSAATGDAVGGQVLGIVSAGDTSVDASNSSEDVDVETGDSSAASDVAAYVGQVVGGTEITAADVIVGEANNAQDGDNDLDVSQVSEATSGDGVGGQVIGVVTSAGGSADVVAANSSEDVGIESGDADSANDLAGQVGQTIGTISISAADVTVSFADNAQDGDNALDAEQDATASTGDGVGGQVIGVVSAGDATVDATNASTDVDLETGDADSTNDLAALIGQSESSFDLDAADVEAGGADNAQDGDNAKDASQVASASTGDAVGGQVWGVVTSAGGSADLVAANTTEDADASTGDSDFNNQEEAFVGQSIGSIDI